MGRRGLAVIAGVVALSWSLRRLPGEWLEVDDPLPASADAIVVLAGALESRTLEAAALYRAGLAPRVVVTRERLVPGAATLHARGVIHPDSDTRTIDVLRQLGVPSSAIVRLGRRTHSTASEARTIARWACRRQLRRIIVVTGRSHSRRARTILARVLEPAVGLTMHSTPYDGFRGWRWYRRRHHAKEVLSEWQKFVHHWVRERWTLQPCGGLGQLPLI